MCANKVLFPAELMHMINISFRGIDMQGRANVGVFRKAITSSLETDPQIGVLLIQGVEKVEFSLGISVWQLFI